jgi:hypothetical protein
MLVTEAPLSTRFLQTREPVKPLPPNTVTDKEEPGDKLDINSMAKANMGEGYVTVDDSRKEWVTEKTDVGGWCQRKISK